MELFTGPYAAAQAGALAIPVVWAIWAAINSSETERSRKGLHPITKACLWAFGAVAFVVGMIAAANTFGLI